MWWMTLALAQTPGTPAPAACPLVRDAVDQAWLQYNDA